MDFTRDTNYVPLTATRLPKGADILPFIVGVRIDMQIAATRLLDRSYSITGASDYIDTAASGYLTSEFVEEDSMGLAGGGDSSAPVSGDTGPKKKKRNPEAEKAAREKAARDALAQAGRDYSAWLAQLSKAGQKDANDGPMGLAYQAQQTQITADINYAKASLRNVPPVQFLINPQSFTVSSSRIVTDGNWARNGPSHVVEHWGDAQDTITAQGRVAGFYASFKDAARQKQSGLSRSNRSFTKSYENLMSLVLLYRNNGAVKTVDYADVRGQATTKQDNIALMAPMYIYYDNTLYFGSFNSFQLTEEAEAPFTLSYTFEFVARQTILLDKPVTPRR